VADVDNTAPARAKEDGSVQPSLAVDERAPNEKVAAGKMDERKIPARFEKRNVFDPHDPTFDTVSQENEIVPMKYDGLAFLAFRSGSRRRLRFFLECYYNRNGAGRLMANKAYRNGYFISSSMQSGEHLID
jgi:hypothetical protein